MDSRIQLMDEMNRLRHDILSMGTRVEQNLAKALEALRTGDPALAAEVKADDEVVNALQLKIEDQAAILIATQAPVARDLRELVSVLKVTDNLERAGDHAVHLAKLAKRQAERPALAETIRLERMAELGGEMLRGAVKAWLDRDAGEAARVAALDDGIDHEHKALVSETLEFMKGHPEDVELASRLIKVSGFLERLGDHVTNICEAVVFMVEGRHVELNE